MKSTAHKNRALYTKHVLLIQIVQERRVWARGHPKRAFTARREGTGIEGSGVAQSNTHAEWLTYQWREIRLTDTAAERQCESELHTGLRQVRSSVSGRAGARNARRRSAIARRVEPGAKDAA